MVLSGSMEPAFYRGDILFLNMGRAPLRTGEIVVFNIDGRDIPIVHRIIKFHERTPGGRIDILTKASSSGSSACCTGHFTARLSAPDTCAGRRKQA